MYQRPRDTGEEFRFFFETDDAARWRERRFFQKKTHYERALSHYVSHPDHCSILLQARR